MKVLTGVCSALATGFNKLRTTAMKPSKREGLGRAVTGEQLLVAPHAAGDLRPRPGSCRRTPPDHQLSRRR
ncbi:MAG TPA: hypothetical protein VE476_14730, partial [Propionibacteriaceae bacterium]|nr:hypothetical protein [Propionibacteriaceae bacterium]